MGGVDKIDQLIAYYRIFLKSKKWTLRMVFHAIDMAICKSWLEYLQDCKLLGIEKKKQMDLLHFKMRLADNLINLGRSDNRKRPRGRLTSASTPSPSPPTKKKTTNELRPYQETLYDNTGHLPTSGEKQRRKMENCNGKTHVMCENVIFIYVSLSTPIIVLLNFTKNNNNSFVVININN